MNNHCFICICCLLSIQQYILDTRMLYIKDTLSQTINIIRFSEILRMFYETRRSLSIENISFSRNCDIKRTICGRVDSAMDSHTTCLRFKTRWVRYFLPSFRVTTTITAPFI